MNWFQDIKESQFQTDQEEEINELLKSKIEKLKEKLPPGYRITRTKTGWEIIGPEHTYSVEKSPLGWGVRPKEYKDDYFVREEQESKYPDILALEMAIPRIKFRDTVTKLQKILQKNIKNN